MLFSCAENYRLLSRKLLSSNESEEDNVFVQSVDESISSSTLCLRTYFDNMKREERRKAEIEQIFDNPPVSSEAADQPSEQTEDEPYTEAPAIEYVETSQEITRRRALEQKLKSKPKKSKKRRKFV